MSATVCFCDFCISVLNCQSPSTEWEALKFLIQECGWIYVFHDICLVCDRPLYLHFDEQQRLHAEGEPAIEFTDGYSIYAYHGVILPQKYGIYCPQEWQSEWLLEEENAELRRVLIQGIGYERIMKDLEATEIDLYQEYTLLKINDNVDVEEIYLLKMICPSTGFVHVLRVPPDVTSAREAISWVNWGINPDDFSRQT